MGLKKNYFGKLRSSSPVKMHEGKPHSKKDGQQIVDDLEYKTQSERGMSDAEYAKYFGEGSIHRPNLDEVVVRSDVDYNQYPLFDELSDQQKEYFNDSGAIGRGVRRRAQTSEGLAGDVTDMVTGMLVDQPLAVLQTPQSLMVEGIEALRGNPYNFADALSPGSQRLPSETMGFEDKPGWDLGGSLNTAMDIVADPTNLIGAGLLTKGYKGAKAVKGLANKADDLVYSLAAKGDEAASAASKLPESPGIFGRFNPKTRESMYNTLEDLSKNAEVSKFERLKTMERLNTPEGRKRLYDQELGYLQGEMEKLRKTLQNPKAQAHPFIRKQTPGNEFLEIEQNVLGGLGTKTKKLFDADLAEQAQKNVDFRIQEISRPNLNERAAEAIKGGKLNYSQAEDILYNSVPQKYLDSNATFGGFKQANDVNRFSLQGVQNASQLNKGNFILGNKNLPKPKTTYAHEQQHGFQVGRTTPLDKDLSSGIKPNKEVLDYNKKYDDLLSARDNISAYSDNFVEKYKAADSKLKDLVANKPASVIDYNYFKYGGSGNMEPRAFAGELRQSLLDQGFIKNPYDKITPQILSKAKNYFDKNPAIQAVLKSGGRDVNVSGTRILDFMDKSKSNFSSLAKSMNKLPAITGGLFSGKMVFSGDKNK